MMFYARTLVQTLCCFACVAVFLSGEARSQYGFNAIPWNGSIGGQPWGNSYVASTLQVPAWNGYANVVGTWGNGVQNWQLGAVTLNTANGVLVQQVVPGSIADRAGLRSGDLIVSVAGSQVGFTGGRLVDLIYEINRRMDANGQVRLTVLDAVSRQLRTKTLQITPQYSSNGAVTGRVFMDTTSGWSGNYTLKVELLNVSRPYLSASGGSTYVNAYGPGPFPFSIYANPTYVNSSDRYRLVASLYDANRQVIAYGTLDIVSPTSAPGAVYDLRLSPTASSLPSYLPSYGSYYPNQNLVNEAFRRYLNREPSVSELQAWLQQLATNSISLQEMKAEILASPSFYDRVGNNPDQFIRLMIESSSQFIAPLDALQFWRVRLDQLNGDRLTLAREYIQSLG